MNSPVTMSSNENAKKKRSQTLKWIFFVLLAIVFVADFLAERHHPAFPWDSIPGFSAVYGFVSVVIIIIISKVVGAILITKKEDYYD